MKKYDAVIIGFGKGGKTIAAYLGGQGKEVAVIEKSEKMYGGTCINVGCIPTKSLVNSARKAKEANPADYEGKNRLYQAAIEEKDRLTSMLRGKNYAKLNDQETITVIHGTATFTAPKRIRVKTEEDTFEIEGEQIFINTGSTPVIPPILGIKDSPRVYVSETMLDVKELPKRLVIIGGGYIGLEFASFYTNFGTQVTVLQDGDRFIPREDPDLAEEIQKVFENRGVRFLFSAKTQKIEDLGAEAVLTYEQGGAVQTIAADAVLVATGRRPNTDDLNLEAAGIEKTARGAVKVDEYLRASVPDVWAMGDVAGGLQFTYISLDDYRIVKSQLNGRTPEHSTGGRNVPYSVFIEPAFSRVGLNEQEAIEKGYQVRIAKLPAAAIPKAQVLQKPEGLLKAVIDEKTDRILGAMLFCEESYEMINIVKLAMDADLPYTFLRDQIFTHPTMSEALNDLFSV